MDRINTIHERILIDGADAWKEELFYIAKILKIMTKLVELKITWENADGTQYEFRIGQHDQPK